MRIPWTGHVGKDEVLKSIEKKGHLCLNTVQISRTLNEERRFGKLTPTGHSEGKRAELNET